jgi:DNA mismatch endonuclease (patch repair protein)
MPDIVDKATRSRMMSGIRSKDTKAEVQIRKNLFSLGFRYRLHDSKLPGKPDIIFPRYKAVIFIHGCFWHMHYCELFKMPSSNVAFWQKKLNRNKEKDAENYAALKARGWRIMIIWECAFRGRGKKKYKAFDAIAKKTAKWLHSGKRSTEIRN